MRIVKNAIHRLGQFLDPFFEVRLPMSVWLDNTLLRMYKTRL